MCTVTYLPKPSGWLLTNNRDESPLRASSHLVKNSLDQQTILYPPDDKGGTWLAINDAGRLVCLLNGGFEKHAHRPPYRHSRGLIVLDAVRSNDIESYIRNIDLDNIEPFTLIAIDKKTFIEWVWDGHLSHVKPLDKEANYIWSSSTLYNNRQKERRNEFFQNFISKNKPTPNNLLSFHRSKPFGEPETDFWMDRPGVKSIAISQVESDGEKMTFKYINLLEESTLVSELSI